VLVRLALLILFSSALWAEQPVRRHWTSFAYPASFEHISVESGLSQSTVHCILQDRKGFLWFGTDTGLNRYDGHRFQVFHPGKDPARSLSGDWILNLLEDRRGYLWVATRDGGLSILDPETDTWLPLPPDASGFPSKTINALAEDPEGHVWIDSLAGGLHRVSKHWRMPARPFFEPISTSPSGLASPQEQGITALFFDRKGTLWIGSLFFGLGKRVSGPGEKPVFSYYAHDPKRPGASAPSAIRWIQEDAFGLLWMGTDHGPYNFDPESGVFRQWTTVEGESLSLGNDRVYQILRDRTGTLWMGCDGSGLLKVLPRTSKNDPVRFQRFAHDPKDRRSLSGNGVQCVFEDRSGVLWVSAYQAGLNKLVLHPNRDQNRETPSMFQYRNNPADPSSLSGNAVAAIGEDRFGNLWVGTDGYGLDRVRPPARPGERMRFQRFRADSKAGPGSLQSDVILTTHLDPRKTLWLGTYNAGLVRVDQTSAGAPPRFTHFLNIPGDPAIPRVNFIRCIVDDGEGGFWLGFDGTGLHRFNPTTGKGKYYEWGGGPKRSSSETIFRMVKDAYGTLWLATPFGLNRFNPETEEFRVYAFGGARSPGSTFVNTVLLEEGVLWIGTKGGGLVKTVVPPWNGPEPEFTAYGTREGLPSQVVLGILPDGQGNLWLSTDRSICRFDIQKSKGIPFTWQGELRKAEFIWNACYRSSSGECFFGSNDGLTLFHPEDQAHHPVAPPVAITGFQILNKPVPLPLRTTRWPSREGIQEITLGPKDSVFSFDFAALHFAAPERNQYAYQLEGLDPAWNEVGNQHFVSFTTLPPRTYVLRVKAANCDGVWGEEGLQLKIHVLPAWYKTWWFRTLLIVGGAGALFAGAAWYLAALRRRNRYLEEAMAEQAKQLHEAETLNALIHLTETAVAATDDIQRWVNEMAREVAKAVEADQIDVWEISGESFQAITSTLEVPAASLQEFESRISPEIMAIRGPQGETLAALKVLGKATPWTPLESELLASFTQHLASAYHLKSLRQSLLETRQQRALDRKTLAAQGQGVLQICPTCHRCYDEGPDTCPVDGALLDAPRLLPFRFLGRYRLERLLGEGGTAHVFEAWDEKLARSVAVKAIKPSNFLSDQARQRFAREASLLARLEHPSIVSIFDSRELEDGTVFLVMEYLKGMTVGRLIRTYGPARPSQAAFLLRQVASALASTHAKGLVHRDLKPENLFAVAGGEWIHYKVLDFGLAKGDFTETGFTQTGTLMGTPNYMSPEQARGKSVDWRSDLYSLAAILYEVLSGRPVVHARALADIFLEVISREPPPLRTLMPGCPTEVDHLLHQGLAKNPWQRPEDLLAWAGRLDAALQAWAVEMPGWPDRCDEDISSSFGAEETLDLAGGQPPTL